MFYKATNPNRRPTLPIIRITLNPILNRLEGITNHNLITSEIPVVCIGYQTHLGPTVYVTAVYEAIMW